jgi:peptide chain release factor 2
MKGEFDSLGAILEINGGAGGTEAQDWAHMLLRMYLRWAERKGFDIEEVDYHQGEEAGIKNATYLIRGDYAYGLLRSEQGVHRLVRISPFDSNARRHTSFASIAVTPEIDDAIEVEIDEKDLRVDTYRSSGSGGQHVNKTDSAVRLTHIPSGIVVACQNERSQHKNKDRAMKMLKAKLYERERAEHQARMDEIKGERRKVDFGSQIRSYVMQPYQMVKDLRTGFESSDVDGILDGKIDPFIEHYLMSGLSGVQQE